MSVRALTSRLSTLIVRVMNISEKAAALLSCLPTAELQNQDVVYRKLAGAGCVREAVAILNLDETDYSCLLNDVVGEYQAMN